MSLPETSKKSSQYKSLDGWRGLACLFVVLLHTYGSLKSKTGVADYDILAAISVYGGLGVQVFFVISGYCIINAACSIIRKDKSVRDFAWARCRRIFPPYWLALPFFVVTHLVGYMMLSRGAVASSTSAYENPLTQGFSFYLANFTLTHYVFGQKYLNDVAWSLNFEIAFYLVCAILIALSRVAKGQAARIRFLLNGSHVLTIGCLAIMLVRPEGLSFPLNLWPQFGLGIVVYDLLQMPQTAINRALSAVAALLTLAMGFRVLGNDIQLEYHSRAIAWFVCLGFATFLVVGRKWDERACANKVWNKLCWLGTASYTVYLLHTVFIIFITQAIAMVKIPAAFSPVVGPLVAAVAVAICCAFYPKIEVPFLGHPPRKVPPVPEPSGSPETPHLGGQTSPARVETP